MPIIEVSSDDHYESIIDKYQDRILVFSAKWCGPCSKIRPEWTKWSTSHPNHTIFYIDVDKCSYTAELFDVEAMPTFVKLSSDGRISHRFVGSNVQKLLSWLSLSL